MLNRISVKYQKFLRGQGRATRSEYVTVIVGSVILSAISIYVIAVVASLAGDALDRIYGTGWEDSWVIFPFFFLYVVLGLGVAAFLVLQVWLAVAACIRRLHDCDFPGWPAFLFFLPYIGAVLILILGFWFPHEPNRYGEDPRQFRKAYDA